MWTKDVANQAVTAATTKINLGPGSDVTCLHSCSIVSLISNKFDLFNHIFLSLNMPILNYIYFYFSFVCIMLNYSMNCKQCLQEWFIYSLVVCYGDNF